jgi:integrase
MAGHYGHGTVSSTKNEKGLWEGRVDLGVGADGRRIRKRVKAKTKDELARKMNALHAARDGGTPTPDQATSTARWLTTWGAEVLPGTVADKTAESYRWVLAKYVTPHIGRVPLAKLGPEHVNRMMRALEAQGLSPRTRAYARAVLRRALRQALEWGKVTRNAAALVQAPKKAGTKLDDRLDADQADKILKAAKGDRLEALAVLVLATGLRKGEALRLRWTDVDLDAATLTVVKAKTQAGVRTIALPPFVVTALRQHRRRQLRERAAARVWIDPEVVFASTVGTPLEPRNVTRWWHALTIKAGVGRRRFHATRHTAATLMLNNGVPLEVVSMTLGHAGLAITADVYANVEPELQRTAADTMQTVLGSRR